MLAVDLFCGLGGWAEGLLDEGYDVIGFDIEKRPYPGQLVLQDVTTLDGAQFKDATVIVASPPCQAYSYMAMPWTRAKRIAEEIQRSQQATDALNTLFESCFRIQREASAAAGRYIPMVVENVRGAVKWVGPAQGKYGSFYLWGDVPGLLPIPTRGQKFNPDGTNHGQGSWFAVADSKNRGASGVKVPSFRFDGNGGSFQTASVRRTDDGTKNSGGSWFNIANNTTSGVGNNPARGRNSSRKQASALIAKIPYPLARHVAQVYKEC